MNHGESVAIKNARFVRKALKRYKHASFFALFHQTPWLRDFWRGTNRGVYPDDFLCEIEALMPTGEASTG